MSVLYGLHPTHALACLCRGLPIGTKYKLCAHKVRRGTVNGSPVTGPL